LAKRSGELIAQFDVVGTELNEVFASGVEQLAEGLCGGPLVGGVA
jgi:hypothetical protein